MDPGRYFCPKISRRYYRNNCKSIIRIYNAKNEIKIIGVRHGEKLYETLVNREEMAKSEDLENYYRIPADNRDLNYNKYFKEGEAKIATMEEYTSHNTIRLSLEETKKLLLKLHQIRKDVL